MQEVKQGSAQVIVLKVSYKLLTPITHNMLLKHHKRATLVNYPENFC